MSFWCPQSICHLRIRNKSSIATNSRRHLLPKEASPRGAPKESDLECKPYQEEPGLTKQSCSFQKTHSIFKENQFALLRTSLSQPGSEGTAAGLGVGSENWAWHYVSHPKNRTSSKSSASANKAECEAIFLQKRRFEISRGPLVNERTTLECSNDPMIPILV